MLLRYLYIIFIGVLLSLFVGVGIATFYKAPKAPEYPVTVPQKAMDSQPAGTVSAEKTARAEADYQKKSDAYIKTYDTYQRNVSTIAITAAVIILIISLTILTRLPVITDGILLGGVFTLIYSIFRGFETNNETFRFIVISIGLLVALILGYIKFIKPTAGRKR